MIIVDLGTMDPNTDPLKYVNSLSNVVDQIENQSIIISEEAKKHLNQFDPNEVIPTHKFEFTYPIDICYVMTPNRLGQYDVNRGSFQEIEDPFFSQVFVSVN